MKKRCDILFLLLIGLVIISLGAAIFILPQKSFSEKENRSLATRPSLSLDGVISGEYFERLGDFYDDQFPLRNSFTAVRALLELSLGRQESNGVIIADNAIITRSAKINTNILTKNLALISKLDNALLYVPPSTREVYKNPMRDLTVSSLLPEDTAEDFLALCERNDEYIYYKTDHHWTTRGAYIAYEQICNRLSVTPFPDEYFSKEKVCSDFRGTSFSRSCLPKALIKADEIILYRYNGDKKITVINHESNESFNGFYQMQHLEQTDKYRVFLGGNYAYISILNDIPKPKLLLIKDSFANTLVPFLALHFDIEMIDPRYCSKSFLSEQLERTDVDNIIFLLSMDTLSSSIWG